MRDLPTKSESFGPTCPCPVITIFYLVHIWLFAHISLIISLGSQVEDVRRFVWSRTLRCAADPAVLLASSHGGDQELDHSTLKPLRGPTYMHVSDSGIFCDQLSLRCVPGKPSNYLVCFRRISVCRSCPWLESRKSWSWMRMSR